MKMSQKINKIKPIKTIIHIISKIPKKTILIQVLEFLPNNTIYIQNSCLAKIMTYQMHIKIMIIKGKFLKNKTIKFKA